MSGPKHVETRKRMWMVELHSIDAARQLVGKDVTVKDEAGKPQEVKVQPYFTGGPTRFVTDRTDAISLEEIAFKIATMVPRTFFVMDDMKIGNTTGPKKRIIFAHPPGFQKVEIAFGDYKIRFWPEDLTGTCHFCKGSHGPTCTLCQRVDGDDWDLEYYRLPDEASS
ncbi:hypothetical protein N7461_000875 [Penicillium sp. DV-2018c]|nr:hypothetical protein N7461_000875 [Penicillium sp. DV-2018c]